MVGCVILGLSPGLGAGAASLVEEEWVVSYDGPCSGADWASDMCLDSEGDVIVTGSGDMTTTNHDAVTVKYDPDGNELWVATYDDPYGEDVDFDRSFAVAVDSDDNIYIAGWARGATSTDYLTVAYDPDGNELWVATWDSPYQLFDWACDVVVDSDGRVYVAGTIWTTDQGEDIAIVCYDSSGELLWTDTYSGEDGVSDFPSCLSICEVEGTRAFVVGYANYVDAPNTADGIALAYDDEGGLLWECCYDGGGDGVDAFNEVVFDISGNAYVTGATVVDDEDHEDLLLMAFDYSGDELWTTAVDGGEGGMESGYDLTIDGSGNLYACGFVNGILPDDPYTDYYYHTDAVVLACDPDGDILWTDVCDPGDDDCYFRDLAVSDEGYLYVTGDVFAEEITDNVALTKIYDTDGNELWSDQFHLTDETGDYGWRIAVSDGGDFYVFGAAYVDYYQEDMVLRKYHHFTVASDYVEEVKGCIDGLPDSAFSKNADQRASALSSKLDAVAKMMDDGEYQDAIDKLEGDIIPKVDGVEKGNESDWITDPDAQQALCEMLQALVDYLEPLA